MEPRARTVVKDCQVSMVLKENKGSLVKLDKREKMEDEVLQEQWAVKDQRERQEGSV
jgi:hypothetical protein